MSILSLYSSSTNGRKRSIKLQSRLDCSEVVSNFIKTIRKTMPDLNKLEGSRVKSVVDADWLLGMLNYPPLRPHILHDIGDLKGTLQTFQYLPSNLGKGYVFFFVCTGCHSRVRHLYKPDGTFDLLCRSCHRLTYDNYSTQGFIASNF